MKKKPTANIKSSKVTVKFANTGKLEKTDVFRKKYVKAVSYLVDIMWEMEDVPSLITPEIASKVSTELNARSLQCAGKQASGIVRGTRKKAKKRLWKYNEFMKDGEFKKARKLMAYINKHPIGKPTIDQINPQLDSRFVDIVLGGETSFDGWITFSSIGFKEKICIPFKLTKHIQRLIAQGFKMKKSVCLNSESITLCFEKEEEIPIVAEGTTIGVDIGIKSLYSVSDGRQSTEDIHGHTLDTIQKTMVLKKYGSKNFGRCQRHRINHTNMILNQLNLNGVRTLKLENIKNLRRNKRTSKYLARWTYADIYRKFEDMCRQSGVQIVYIDQTYTSQRCSSCGWTRKGNRHGVSFKCKACGFTANADLNASVNISLDLPPIGKQKRLQRPNRKGFYWDVVRREPIVPTVTEAELSLEEISI